MITKRRGQLILVVVLVLWLNPYVQKANAESVQAPAFVHSQTGDSFSQLTFEKTASFHPSWSPDGEYIVFHRRVDGWRHIFTMRADGSNVQQLTSGDNANLDAAWSSTDRIAFTCNRNQTEQICVINADGTGFTQLTTGSSANSQPSWSPDGSSIIYNHGCSIFGMDADGSKVTELLKGSEFQCYSYAEFSPDGMKLAFRYGSAGSSAIYVVDGNSSVLQVTDDTVNNRAPSWSPDGKRLVFEREQELYIVNADGSGLTLLSPNGRYPAWSPDGTTIAFELGMGKDATYNDALYQIVTINVSGR